MIHIISPIRLFFSPVTRRRRRRYNAGKILLLPIAAAVLALSSCEDENATKPTPQITVQTEPVGAGLTVIGFAIVGAAVVVVLGRLLR
jgi:hypothetical protein